MPACFQGTGLAGSAMDPRLQPVVVVVVVVPFEVVVGATKH